MLTNLVLKCLVLYDKGYIEFINLAKELNDYINKNSHISEYKINELQIDLRLNKILTKEQKRTVIELKNSADNILIKCACYILLGYAEEFEIEFEKLNEEQKAEFVEYPIYNLCKN